MSKTLLAIVILAAGQGTRMKSAKPKVMHELAGLPLISHVVRTAEKLKPQKIVVVIGPDMEDVAAAVKPHATVIQKTRKGTGDAVRTALPELKNFKGVDILVLYGDVPLVESSDLKKLVLKRVKEKAGISLAVMHAEHPNSYGRVTLNKDGTLENIIEVRDANAKQKDIMLCNAGFMCIDGGKLEGWLNKIKNKNSQGEFYLTDLPSIAAQDGMKTVIVEIDEASGQGVNSRLDLAFTEKEFQDRARLKMLESGVTLKEPGSVYFAHDTKIASDVIIEPHVVFGPGVEIAGNVTIKSFSHIEGTKIAAGASIGPFARIRPGTVIGNDVKIGNFVEVKKSKIGKGSKINHLAYVGDTHMDESVNFSAGAITVNYDGYDKHETKIGKGVMVGSNVNLVAPVTINEGAFIAAGSTITENVPADALAIARGTADTRKGWAAEYRRRKQKGKKK